MSQPEGNNKPAATEATANENGFKDRPRPVTIFRHETAKTSAVLEQAAQERQTVDNQVDVLSKSYAPSLEACEKQLKAAGEQRINVRKATVESLTAEVAGSEQSIADLRKKLSEEATKLERSQGALGTAAKELSSESGKIAKEHKAATRTRKKELNGELKTARRERKAVYKQTRQKIRRERWNTVKNTTREAVAFLPDLTVRFGKAAKHGISELGGIFHRSAKSAQKGFNEPTLFSVTREKPLAPPQAPKAPGQ